MALTFRTKFFATQPFSKILTVFVAIMIGWPLPLAALQILWLNIITDVLPAMALALEPSAPNVMKRKPRDPQERLLNAPFAWLITWQGMLLAAVTLAAFGVGLARYSDDLVVITTTGSQRFFRSSLGYLPERLATRTDVSRES